VPYEAIDYYKSGVLQFSDVDDFMILEPETCKSCARHRHDARDT